MEVIVPIILQYGGPGVIIVALGYTVIKLFNLFIDSQEKRITTETRVTTAIEANSDALEQLKDAVNSRKGSR